MRLLDFLLLFKQTVDNIKEEINETMTDRKEYLREYRITYYEKNKERLNNISKEYYKENKEDMTAYHKQYRAENAEKIKENYKKYNMKVICDVCGSTVSRHHMAGHKKTNKCTKHNQ